MLAKPVLITLKFNSAITACPITGVIVPRDNFISPAPFVDSTFIPKAELLDFKNSLYACYSNIKHIKYEISNDKPTNIVNYCNKLNFLKK